MNDVNPEQGDHNAVFSTKVVGTITGLFRVFSYQRGYRWGRSEVRQLLDDIEESAGSLYRLQPIVVKPIGDGAWELIDGQQRLTTLYLIYRFMTKSGLKNVPPLYEIDYQTRPGSAEFLRDPDVAEASRNIDYHFLHRAYREIESWFGPEVGHDRQERADALFLALKKHVEVIWYQARQSEDSIELFSRLNIGRIPLTAAELVKAHLLTQLKASDSGHVHAVAAQWDSIERDLRRRDIWAFVSKEEADSYPTRITLLLDTIAARYPVDGDFGNHQTFEGLRKHISADPKHIWNEVVELHAHILGWFENHDLYHRIGFLVAVGEKFAHVVQWGRGKSASDFSNAINERIKKKLELTREELAAIGYETEGDRSKAQRALLLMNVETVRGRDSSGERFPFAEHHSGRWSLEHIHAQNAEALTTEDEWFDWLDSHLKVLDSLPASRRRDELIGRVKTITKRPVKRTDFQAHAADVLDFLSSGSGQEGVSAVGEIHDITNLALLQRGANSALSNSAFEVKRRMILTMDKDGDYIPVCTRQVFLKYFGDKGARSAYVWSPQDRKAYFAALEATLLPYLKPNPKETSDA